MGLSQPSVPSSPAHRHIAFLANWSASLALTADVEHVLVAADIAPGDLILDPETSNTLELPADGEISLPAGTYSIQAYARADFDVAPGDGVDALYVSVQFERDGAGEDDLGKAGVLLAAKNVTETTPTPPVIYNAPSWSVNGAGIGDGVSTDVSPAYDAVVMLRTPHTMTIRLTAPPDDATVTEFEFVVARLA